MASILSLTTLQTALEVGAIYSLVALALFAACFVLSYVVCALSAGSFQFWHVWGWFVK